MNTLAPSISPARDALLKRALFRGQDLTLENPEYLRAATAFLVEQLSSDIGSGDLTVQALELAEETVRGGIFAKEPGVVAGIEELCWLLGRGGISLRRLKKDGDRVECGEGIAELQGGRNQLLAYERTGLNLLQRMSGIATMTRHFQDIADRGNDRGNIGRRNSAARIVATRKTPWGLLDKRAVHLGGGGTHRLGLSDAILVKNNHLALLAANEEEAADLAVRRTWAHRQGAGFIEVEVRSRAAALAAARTFRLMQHSEQPYDPSSCPCLLMLDNMTPGEISRILESLRSENLLEHILIEASGNMTEDNVEAYAACGVDAISVGALTHSPRALDLCQRLPQTDKVK